MRLARGKSFSGEAAVGIAYTTSCNQVGKEVVGMCCKGIVPVGSHLHFLYGS